TKCQDYDLAICGQWTAFNALYGQWDGAKREPVADVSCWRHFLDRMLSLDHDGSLAEILSEHRPLVLAIFDDEYLSKYFWQDPTYQRATKARKTKFSAQSWYVEKNWLLILDRLVERIYLLRCQIVHGAATYNSSYNRIAIRHCVQMMNHILFAFLHIWIHQAANEDWGIMCYPPQR
ncbi:MAG: hypothetical protein P1U77_29185, partial [Rubripirellula sp.]|nr:hypothetical protein [Rubripirellula sp.]